MSILRNKFKVRFVQVPNVLVTDTRISIPARLVYVYLRSKPDGWVVRNVDVMRSLGIKDHGAMAKYWRELEATGWIIRHKTAAGTYDYELSEAEPIGEKPIKGNTAIVENPIEGNPPIISNTDDCNNTEDILNNKKEKKSHAYTEHTDDEKKKLQETAAVVKKEYPRCNYPIPTARATLAAVKRIAKEREIDIIAACEYLQQRVRLYAEYKYGEDRQYLPEAHNWLDDGGYDAEESNWSRGAENEQPYKPKNF